MKFVLTMELKMLGARLEPRTNQDGFVEKNPGTPLYYSLVLLFRYLCQLVYYWNRWRTRQQTLVMFCPILLTVGQNSSRTLRVCWVKYGRGREGPLSTPLYRTNGVSIFIDYCTAPRDTRKGGRRRKRHSTSTRVWGQQLFFPRLLRVTGRARRAALIKLPPPLPLL